MVKITHTQFNGIMEAILNFFDEHYVLATAAEETRRRFPTASPSEENLFVIRIRISVKEDTSDLNVKRAGYIYVFGNANPPYDGNHVYEADDEIVHTKSENVWFSVKVAMNSWMMFDLSSNRMIDYKFGTLNE